MGTLRARHVSRVSGKRGLNCAAFHGTLLPAMNPIPDWLLPTILLAPAMLWMFLGVGIPWALAVLPRTDWRNRMTVLAVALALGPALTTAAMFVIGTFGHFTRDNVLIASAVVALIG